MKKAVILIAFLVSVLVLSSCSFVPGDGSGLSNDNLSGDSSDQSTLSGGAITVDFIIDGVKETKSFAKGEKIEYPTPPEKENFVFSGWYFDEQGKEPAYLGSSLADKLTLYAVYTYDYREAINKVSLEYIKACVGIEVLHKKTSFGVPTSTHKVTGSGVIFDESDGLYYVLTNCHVIENVSGYGSREYSVVDCYGNSRSAKLIAKNSASDLALLSIAKENVALGTLSFADSDSKIGDIVIAVGSPGGLDNNVTFGEIKEIDSLNQGDIGYLSFPVIWHDAPMDHGSSGGVLMNGSFEIVGINYAVGTSQSTNKFVCGLAVPRSKVLEFINANR